MSLVYNSLRQAAICLIFSLVLANQFRKVTYETFSFRAFRALLRHYSDIVWN